MSILPRLRFLPFALALLFATLVLAAPAHAGALGIRDEAHSFSADDASRLRSVVAASPFDARVVVTSEYADAQELSRYVRTLVTEPNLVVVGLDPQHRHVQVHFGTGSRIPRAAWPAIERAGNDAFRAADWEGGTAAILRAAAQAVAAGPGEETPAAAPRPSVFGPGLLLLLLAGGIGLAVFLARRRSTYGSVGGPGYGPGPYSGPGYPGYPPQQGGLGPLGGGLIGAGLGGLAGYELGKIEGEREQRERDPGFDQGSAADPGDNFDAGGGGSSWDDGDGGGGGFDSGGGDSGGGGSDF